MFFKTKKKEESKPISLDGLNWDNCNMQTNGELFFLQMYAKHWSLALDIGANEGDYSNLIKTINPNVKLICFEPNPALISKIKEKDIGAIYNVAVGDCNGVVEFNINSEDSTQSSVYRENVNTKKIKVPSITLDKFSEDNNIDYFDFIKIDTEGFEHQVILGAKELCSKQKIGMIQFEYGGTFLDANKKLKDIYDILIENYIICHLNPTGLIPIKYSSEIETYRYSNWIAISKKY